MVVSVSRLTLDDARRMVAAALRQAEAEGCAVTAVVVDAGGHPIALERQDVCPIGSIVIAQEKARTAVFFAMPTAQMESACKSFPALATLPNLLPFSGGLPVIIDGTVVGAIGASGGSGKQDVACAQAGLDALAPG